MQRSLSEKYGIICAIKRRPNDQNGLHTWMEVYLATPRNFEASLKDALSQTDIPTFIEGQRNLEYFLDYSICA